MPTEYPSPFHLCPISRAGSLLYFRPPPHRDVRIRLETDRQMRDYVDKHHPGAVLALGTAGQFMSKTWSGPANQVMIAVCDRHDVEPRGALVLAFILGGLVPKGTPIPPEHEAASGCIPFDMEHVWADAEDKLPRRN
jgi:hypothetical protein